MSSKEATSSAVPAAGSVSSAVATTSFDSKLQTEEDLTVFVADLMDQMQSRFKSMGDSIVGRMDELSGRLDELERSIAELMDQAGLEPQYGTAGGGILVNTNSSNNSNNNNNNNNNNSSSTSSNNTTSNHNNANTNNASTSDSHTTSTTTPTNKKEPKSETQRAVI